MGADGSWSKTFSKFSLDKPTGWSYAFPMSTTTKQRGSAKDTIITVASDLFYKQGYNATGIQQIIDEAGVSKGTFYAHFKSKDELGLAYMNRRHSEEITHLKKVLSEVKGGPLKRYAAFNEIMKEWVKSMGYRGCAFANMCAEITDCCSPIRKEAKYHYEAFRAVIKDMVEDLIKSDKKYSGLDAQYVADEYMIIQIGALTNSEIYQDTWPFHHAAKSIRRLIGENA